MTTSAKPRLTLYRSGRQKCGHGCGKRVGPRDTIVGYVTEQCAGCQGWSLIFGAHGYASAIPITPELAMTCRRRPKESVATVLADLGMLAS